MDMGCTDLMGVIGRCGDPGGVVVVISILVFASSIEYLTAFLFLPSCSLSTIFLFPPLSVLEGFSVTIPAPIRKEDTLSVVWVNGFESLAAVRAIERVDIDERARVCVVLAVIDVEGAEGADIDVDEVDEEADMVRSGEVMLSDEAECVLILISEKSVASERDSFLPRTDYTIKY